MTTGQRIQAARKAANISQRQLGKSLDVSGSMIAQWENDLRNPKIKTLERMATILNVDVNQLRGENTPPIDTERIMRAHRFIIRNTCAGIEPNDNMSETPDIETQIELIAWVLLLDFTADHTENIWKKIRDDVITEVKDRITNENTTVTTDIVKHALGNCIARKMRAIEHIETT